MLVSIIIASNKIDNYLSEALESIINQTYKNIEIIFIANGINSSDIKDYVKSVTKNHPKIFIYETPITQLAYALNLAIDKSNGFYLIRMDADDISMPDRVEKQVKFMNEYNFDISGTSAYLINENSEIIGKRESMETKEIKNKYLFKCPLIHPSVIMKKESILIMRGYNSGLNSEDYDLWIRSIRSDLKLGNMKEYLIKYRLHRHSTQGSKLAYAEVASYSLREFLLNPSIGKIISILINITKYYKN